jgi:hypothetical protein
MSARAQVRSSFPFVDGEHHEVVVVAAADVSNFPTADDAAPLVVEAGMDHRSSQCFHSKTLVLAPQMNVFRKSPEQMVADHQFVK